MKWKVYPAQGKIISLLQSFDTPGDEVAPRSDEITEYFKNIRSCHRIMLLSDHYKATSFLPKTLPNERERGQAATKNLIVEPAIDIVGNPRT